MNKYKNVDGVWIKPPISGLRHFCKDCGAVHEFDFRLTTGQKLKDGDLEIRVTRNNRATGQIRRQRKLRSKA